MPSVRGKGSDIISSSFPIFTSPGRVDLITPGYLKTPLIFYIIHLFIHSNEFKVKMAYISVHFQNNFKVGINKMFLLKSISTQAILTPRHFSDLTPGHLSLDVSPLLDIFLSQNFNGFGEGEGK